MYKIIGQINRQSINGVTPLNANMCKVEKKGFISMFYKIETIKFNDSTTRDVLQYLSSCGGGWMNSDYNINGEAELTEIV